MCQAPWPTPAAFHTPKGAVLAGRTRPVPTNRCSTREHPLPHTRGQTLALDHETVASAP